ncbi:MAG: SPOR domain-containing protein [Sulfurimicrobium sp.]|nr:SPOR domain-containing protein [Sulfurimicrobium sp.]
MPEQPVNDEQAEIKKRAMRRLAVAASLIAAAVVALTVLNYNKPELAQPVTTSTAPVMEQSAPVQPEPAAEKPLEEEQPAEPLTGQTPPVPDTEATPAAPPAPPPPRVINKPATLAPVTAKPRLEAPAPIPTVKPASIEAPDQAKPPVTPSAKSVAPQKVAPAAEPAPPKGYVVQLGLFSNPDNALQLQKRLAEHGIKSHTETRLQVGPFQTKAEADQAQAKIRSLGINAVLAPVR